MANEIVFFKSVPERSVSSDMIRDYTSLSYCLLSSLMSLCVRYYREKIAFL